ncbi:MAG: nucleotidyltransferase family protein [Bacteroides sp.]
MGNGFKPEEEILLGLLKNAIVPSEGLRCRDTYSENGGADWGKLAGMAGKHAVLPLIYDALSHIENVPQNVLSNAKSVAQRTFLQSHKLLCVSGNLINLMENEGIDVILLKGASTARFYPVPELRKSGDIDLLVKNGESFEHACRLLEKCGYKVKDRQHSQHHTEFRSDEGINIELHRMLAEPFDNEQMNSYVNNLTDEYMDNRVHIKILGYHLTVLTEACDAYYLMLHMLQHFLRSGFGLKLLCDWVVFWNRDIGEEDKNKFLQMIRESRVEGFVKIVTAVCVEYLGLKPENAAFLGIAEYTRDELQEFMKEILSAEEFGKSGKDRMVVMRGSSFTDYAREFHHQMKLNNPKHSKNVLLWPYLWIKTLVVFLINNRRIRGVSSFDIVRKAGARSRVVRNMNLFK